MDQIIQTTNSIETQKIAEEFAHTLSKGDVVVLRGNLGAGKTTFVQGLAKGLGITKRIISPTFIIIRTYVIPDLIRDPNESASSSGIAGQARNDIDFFYHVDLYRLSGEDDIESTGLLEVLEKKDNIVVIEWPEKMGKFLPKRRLDITFEYIDENKRNIYIRKYI